MHILTPAEHVKFDTPPHFHSVERKRFFDISQSLDPLLASFRTPTNQMCFVLTLGYFRATNRFFPRQFHDADAAYVAQQLGFLPGVFDLSAYDEATARRHRQVILDYLGFRPFDAHAKQDLIVEIRTMVRSQIRPKIIFLHALDMLARRKTETPSASKLTELITGEMRRHKHTLTAVIQAQLPSELRELLEALLDKPEPYTAPPPQVQRFKLTLLKQLSQSTKPSKIQATLEDWQTLRMLHDDLTPVLDSLDLTQEGLRYYANAVLKSRTFQVTQRTEDDRLLHLVCFTDHQFYRLQDTLIDVLLKVVQNSLNAYKRHHKDAYYDTRTAGLDHRVGHFRPLRIIV